MSAAMEAAIEGVPSAGFSLLDFKFDADFSVAKQVVHDIAKRMLSHRLPPHTLLNVNIPKLSATQFKGIKLCRQAYAKWEEDFDKRTDPRGKDYYWMVGQFVNMDSGDDTDVQALKDGYAAVVPVQFDFTDMKMKKQLEEEWKDIVK
jgi:5'-nucleotidase